MIHNRSQRLLAVFGCVLLFAACGVAQQSATASSSGKALEPGTNQLGFWGGYSPNNPNLIGITTDRQYFEFDVQYARVLAAGDSWAFKYMVELVPAALINQPRQQQVVQGNVLVLADVPGTKRWIYGGGTSPIGLQMNFRRGHTLQPYLNGTAGMLYFTDQVPVSGSSQFNFTFGWGAGVEIWAHENQSLSLGYKFHHISNANSASRNPGADSNIFYAGYAWSWKKH